MVSKLGTWALAICILDTEGEPEQSGASEKDDRRELKARQQAFGSNKTEVG